MNKINELNILADSQLEHIMLALRANDRDYNIRNVLDPWWCYTRGGLHVGDRQPKKGGGYFDRELNSPCGWKDRERLLAVGWRSTGAKTVMDQGEKALRAKKEADIDICLIVDHVIPIAFIARKLWSDRNQWTCETLREFLDKFFLRAVITKSEDKRLSDEGLSSNMPRNWTFNDDPFTRYAAVGIRKSND